MDPHRKQQATSDGLGLDWPPFRHPPTSVGLFAYRPPISDVRACPVAAGWPPHPPRRLRKGIAAAGASSTRLPLLQQFHLASRASPVRRLGSAGGRETGTILLFPFLCSLGFLFLMKNR
jgi:hypothetical protein